MLLEHLRLGELRVNFQSELPAPKVDIARRITSHRAHRGTLHQFSRGVASVKVFMLNVDQIVYVYFDGYLCKNLFYL